MSLLMFSSLLLLIFCSPPPSSHLRLLTRAAVCFPYLFSPFVLPLFTSCCLPLYCYHHLCLCPKTSLSFLNSTVAFLFPHTWLFLIPLFPLLTRLFLSFTLVLFPLHSSLVVSMWNEGLNGHLGQMQPWGSFHRCTKKRRCILPLTVNNLEGKRPTAWHFVNLKKDDDVSHHFFFVKPQIIDTFCVLREEGSCFDLTWSNQSLLSFRPSEAGKRSPDLQIAQAPQHWWVQTVQPPDWVITQAPHAVWK